MTQTNDPPVIDPRLLEAGGQIALLVEELGTEGTAGQFLGVNPSGNLVFDKAGALEEVATFSDLPAVDPPQLAFVADQSEYYNSNPVTGTPFDIGDASFTRSIDAQGQAPRDVTFSNSGKKLYEVANKDDKIFQSTLSSGFDITTAKLDTSINTQDPVPQGINFNDDGTKLYQIGNFDSKLFQSSLSTPFDISTATVDKSISNPDNDAQGVTFNNDGSRLFIIGSSQNKIYQFNVSTAFDIGTANLTKTRSSQDSDPLDLVFNDDGSILLECGGTDDKIYQSNLSTPFDIATATFQKSIDLDGLTPSGFPHGVDISNDGDKLFITGRDDQITQFNLTTPNDISTATVEKSASTQSPESQDIALSNDGTKLFEVGDTNDKIFESNLSNPFDIGSVTLQTSINAQNSFPAGIEINTSGDRLYEVGSSQLHQYNLSSPNDLSTATLQSSENITGIALSIDPTGSKLFVSNDPPEIIQQFSLQTPFEISSASLSKQIDSNLINPEGLTFSNAGDKLYEIGGDGGPQPLVQMGEMGQPKWQNI